MAKRIRKGDKVVVNCGKDKGKQGEVLQVHGDRVLIANINMVKRHTKPNPQAGKSGGVLEKEATIHISNVALINPSSGRHEKVGFKILEDGRKLRLFRASGDVLDA